jgi:DNA-binding CsgD family transcriptional regulator
MTTLLPNEPGREDGLGSAERFVPGDMRPRREEIEKLWLSGHSTKEIAEKLGGTPLSVARNLREVRRRWDRAAQRQQIAQTPRHIAIYQEAMDAWQRSQRTKTTTTKQYQEDGPVKVTVREADSVGDTRFLRTAMSALKALDQLADKRAAAPPRGAKKTHDVNKLVVSMVNLLTPEQLQRLDAEQIVACREAAESVEREAWGVAREAGGVERRKDRRVGPDREASAGPPEAASVVEVGGPAIADPLHGCPGSCSTVPAPVDAVSVPQADHFEKQQAAAVQKAAEVGDQRSEVTRTNKRRKRRSRFAMTPRRGNFIARWRRLRPVDPRAAGRRRSHVVAIRREAAMPCGPAIGPRKASSLADGYSAPTRVLQGSQTDSEPLSCGEEALSTEY